jgi:hypothetical protein
LSTCISPCNIAIKLPEAGKGIKKRSFGEVEIQSVCAEYGKVLLANGLGVNMCEKERTEDESARHRSGRGLSCSFIANPK